MKETTYTAVKRYDTINEYVNSAEIGRIFDGYANQEKRSAEYLWSNWGIQFNFALVVPVEPKSNYGIPFKVFRFYTTSDNRKIVSQIGIGSTISSDYNNVVLFKNNDLNSNTFTITEILWPKTKEARKVQAQSGFWII